MGGTPPMSQDLRLLMVEDSEDDAELLLRELRRGGYAVTAERVDTPAAMRAALERQTWDLVTSDHGMPKFSAPAALALLKEVQPGLPFVIVSNEIDLTLAVSLMKAGAQDYIQKRELAQVAPAIQRELREVEVRRQRQAAEAALRDSDKRYRDLVELLPEVVYETDLQGNLTIVNRLAHDLFGYSAADFEQGLNLFQMLLPEEHTRARINLSRLLQGEKFPAATYRARRKDGHVFPVEITAVIIRQDQRPVGIRGVLKDITERQNLPPAVSVFSEITARKGVEAELEANRARLRGILDNAGVGIAVTDNTGRYVQVNDHWAALLGYAPGQLLQQSPAEVTHADDQAASRALRQALCRGEINHFDLEQRFVRSDGSLFWGYLSATPLRAPDGTPEAIIDVITDITARRQVEASLQQERDLFMAGPVIVIRWLPGPTWPVTYASPNLFAHFGYTPEDLTSGRLVYTDLIHPEDRAQALTDDKLHFTAGRQDWYEQDYRLARADGQYRWVHDFTRTIRAPNGEPLQFHGYLRDITDSRRAAAELEQRQQELATVGQLVSAIATNLNVAEILDQALRGALSLSGLEGGTVCLVQPGRQTLLLAAAQNASPGLLADFSAGEVSISDCLCGQVALTGVPQILQDNAAGSAFASREALRAEGLRFHAAFPLSVKNQPIGVLCLFAYAEVRPIQRSLDLVQQLCGPIALAIDNARLYEQSQSHAAELEQHVLERTVQLAAINEELEAFSYSVAHDLRVPLRSIDGYSQALLEDCTGKLEPEDYHHLERIRAATQRMHQLIDDLLELSRLTRGDLERIPVDLSALAQTIAAELHQRTPARQAEFVIAPGILVRADVPLISAVLENLLGNAWKFTSRVPAARIEFGEQRQKCDGQEERIYFVRDNGAGFDMTQADKLFQTFQRLHSQEEFPGTGIGLATVKRVIHRHGGRVWAEGEQGQGATFYFTL
jgi:PAS domain S-box-containing protein